MRSRASAGAAKIIALGLGWGETIEVRTVHLPLTFEDGEVRVGTYPVWPTQADMVRR
jgi:hypothetical protein